MKQILILDELILYCGQYLINMNKFEKLSFASSYLLTIFDQTKWCLLCSRWWGWFLGLITIQILIRVYILYYLKCSINCFENRLLDKQLIMRPSDYETMTVGACRNLTRQEVEITLEHTVTEIDSMNKSQIIDFLVACSIIRNV